MSKVPTKIEYFLFILLRDHLTAGEAAGIMQNHVNKMFGEDADCYNVTYDCPNAPWLPEAARGLAEKLVSNG